MSYSLDDYSIGHDFLQDDKITLDIIKELSFYYVIIKIKGKVWKRIIYCHSGPPLQMDIAKRILATNRRDIETEFNVSDESFLSLKFRETTYEGDMYTLRDTHNSWNSLNVTIIYKVVNKAIRLPSLVLTVLMNAYDFPLFLYESKILRVIKNTGSCCEGVCYFNKDKTEMINTFKNYFFYKESPSKFERFMDDEIRSVSTYGVEWVTVRPPVQLLSKVKLNR